MRQLYHSQEEGRPPPKHEEAALMDAVMNHAKWPLRWIHGACKTGGVPPQKYDSQMYQASHELSDLGLDYLPFESAFTYASAGLITLTLDGSRIEPSAYMRDDARYDAYDRIADLQERVHLSHEAGPLLESVRSRVRVKGDWFEYSLDPRLISTGLDAVGTYLSGRFTLPEDWTLTRYSVGDFAKVAKVLWILAFIHFGARVVAAMNRCEGIGYSRALLLMGGNELARRVTRYSGVKINRVKEILGDLTYGSRGIRNPDIAHQPIVRLTSDTCGMAPNLLIGNSLERNLIVLINRLPEERQVYTRLSTHREGLMRARIQDGLTRPNLRFWTGTIKEWADSSDIDMAIISDDERCALLLEMKSFLAPADPREIHERSEEIARGIEQVRIRRALAISSPEPLQNALGINEEYVIHWAVASETSVGGAWIQAEDVPVIRASDLVRNLIAFGSLPRTCDWLHNREYLPVEGKDFLKVERDVTIAGFTLNWYGIDIPNNREPQQPGETV